MDSLDNIRKAIEENVLDGHLLHVVAWQHIKAATIEAHAGDDDIHAALRALAESRGESQCGLAVVSETGDWLLRWWGSASSRPGESLVAAIRSLIPPPMPTRDENCDTLSNYILSANKPSTADALTALARLRKPTKE